MSDLNIHQRILAIMADLTYVQKSDKKVNDQYRFVTHDSVAKAIHPLLVEHGVAMIPRVVSWTQNGNRTEAGMEVDFVNADKPEDKVTVPCFGFGIDSQDKGPGKAVSYATKYAVLKLFVLETGDDPEKDMIEHSRVDVAAETAKLITALDKGDWVTLCEMDRGGESWLTVWSNLDTRKKKAVKDLIKVRDEYRDKINTNAEDDKPSSVNELWDELSKEGKSEVWRCLTENTKDYITQLRKQA